MSGFSGIINGIVTLVDSVNAYTSVANLAYQILASDRYVAYTSLTQSRIITLPAADEVEPGQIIRIADESGNCRPWKYIKINLPGNGDTIHGITITGPVLIWPYESISIQSNGVDAWSVVGRSHHRAIYQEGEPRGTFIIDDDCFNLITATTATTILTPYISGVIGNGGGGGQIFASVNLDGVITTATAVSGGASDRVYLRTLGATSLACSAGLGLLFCEYTIGIYVLPDATNDYVFVCGFIDVINNSYSVDGAWWMIDRSVSNNWLCVTSSNSSRTITDSGIPWAVAAFKLSVEITAAGASVNFYNGETLAITNIDNIPNGATRAFGVGSGYYKKAGTASSLDIYARDRIRVFVKNTGLRTT